MNNSPGATVTVDPLGNDEGNHDRTSLAIIDPSTGDSVTDLVVPGQGVWRVLPGSGLISFAPAVGFIGSPTPVEYRVNTTDGDSLTSTVTVTYVSPAGLPGRPAVVEESIEAPPVRSAAEPQQVPPVLALTGSDARLLATAGVLALGAGTGFLVLGRRRQAHADT